MKKIFIFCLMTLVMFSCNKNTDVENPMVTISFDQQLVSSNSMTRTTSNEFLDIIEKQTPDYVNVTLKNLDLNKTFTCKSNETITIPIGNYEITGGNISGNKVVLSSVGNYVMYQTPSIKIKTNKYQITIDTEEIILNVFYNCYAVFAEIDENESCKVKLYADSYTFYKNGKYYISYFSVDDTHPIEISLTPYDNSTEFIATTYIFSKTYDVNKVYAEYGKYYVIHPQKVDKTNSQFIINLDKMEEGTF